MASTSSDSLQEELEELHICLITRITEEVDIKSREGESFLFHIKYKLGAGIFSSHESLADKIKALETKNIFGLENYEGLKKICTGSGNRNLIKIIETYEDNMKKIRSKYQQNESSESSKEEQIGIKWKPSDIESAQKEEIKRLGVEDSDEQKQKAYEKAKSDLRRQMIDRYRETLLQVPVLPLIPRTNKCSFSEIYIRPRITHEVKGEKGETKEKEVNSMSEIFTKNGVPLKSIYVVGDAGTGKSSFCKYLVNCWCMAHCEENQAENIVHKTDIKKSFSYFFKFGFDMDEYEKEFNGVQEMRKFDFLFHIALRRYQNVVSIHEMLKNHYNSKILDELLENDSAKIIFLLDGLDEWSSEMKTHNQYQTVGLPEQEYLKNYTVVTTSRPWKIHTLKIDDTEIQQMLRLKGFDERCERIMIYRTVSYLNSQKGESKDVIDCRMKLVEECLRSLKEVPIMLQQLICLWFDGKLDKTSKCAVFTGMLELFFK